MTLGVLRVGNLEFGQNGCVNRLIDHLAPQNVLLVLDFRAPFRLATKNVFQTVSS